MHSEEERQEVATEFAYISIEIVVTALPTEDRGHPMVCYPLTDSEH